MSELKKNIVIAVFIGLLIYNVSILLTYPHLDDSRNSETDIIEISDVSQRLDGNGLLFEENVDFDKVGLTFDGGIENAYLIVWDNENAFVFRYISENFHVHDNRIFWEGEDEK